MDEQEEEKPELITKVSKFVPAVGKPDYKQTLNSRLKWSGVAVLCYFVLSHITAFGLQQTGQYQQYFYFQMVLGAKFGSLITLGIGPIVTAGIVLQLLVGSKIIKWDTTKPEGRKKFQSWNKVLAVSLCFIEAAAFVIAGALPVEQNIAIKLFVILQIAGGAIIIILLDDLVTKWGFGSGVSLFIAAGVASQIIIGLFSPLSLPTGKYVGAVPGVIASFAAGDFATGLTYLVPILSTILVFFGILYVSGIHVDIPLSFASLRGFGRTWSLKFLYASVIPVIFISALLANFQMMGKFGATLNAEGNSCNFMGCFDSQGNAKSGIAYYLSSPRNMILQITSGSIPAQEIIRAITYGTFLALGAMIFSIFWVNTAGMDAKSVAGQLDSMGMQIPGYRKDPRIMESVLSRYIPALTVLGGIGIGLLAAGSDFLGAIGSGTGILLTIMIFHDLYERLEREDVEEAHPWIRKIVGE
jgi:preprotein translocase subunit SecY